MRRVSFLTMACALCAAGIPSHGEEPVVSIGRQQAARAAIDWDAHDIDHPQLGPIRYAVQRSAVVTTVDNVRIVSLAFVSCQKGSGKIAIELTNASGSDLAGGLRPTDMPRLVCRSPAPGGGGLVKGDLAARWEISPLGDTLARGLAPAELRRCVSIGVLQSVAPPPGSSRKSQRIEMEITPYDRTLDSVFAACGERSAFAPAGPAPAAARALAPATQPADASWKPARSIPRGRTNVRAAASTDSPIVVKLDPGTRLLAQRASASWWAVKPRSGAGFSGYIRQDRLAFE